MSYNGGVEDTTVDFDTWMHTAPKFIIDLDMRPKSSISSANYLKDCFVAYMTVPVAVYNNRAIEARSRKVSDIVWLKHHLKQEIENGKQFILYDIYYYPAMPIFVETNEELDSIALDEPKMSEPGWVFRYAEIEFPKPKPRPYSLALEGIMESAGFVFWENEDDSPGPGQIDPVGFEEGCPEIGVYTNLILDRFQEIVDKGERTVFKRALQDLIDELRVK